MNRQSSIVIIRDSEGYPYMTYSSYCLCALIVLGILGLVVYIGYVFLNKQDNVNTAEVLDQGVPYLVNVTNTPPGAEKCKAKTTYGFIGNQFFVDKGCSGIFIYTPDGSKKRIGVCTSGNSTHKRCNLQEMLPDIYPHYDPPTNPGLNSLYALPTMSDIKAKNSLNGFVDMTNDQLKLLKQNGNCRANTYGFHGNNMISVTDGCDGTFVFGPLIGSCTSPGIGQQKLCPIGTTDSSGQGLVLGTLLPFDTAKKCQQGENYGFTKKDLAFVNDKMCEGSLKFNTYNVTCEESSCPL